MNRENESVEFVYVVSKQVDSLKSNDASFCCYDPSADPSAYSSQRISCFSAIGAISPAGEDNIVSKKMKSRSANAGQLREWTSF